MRPFEAGTSVVLNLIGEITREAGPGDRIWIAAMGVTGVGVRVGVRVTQKGV